MATDDPRPDDDDREADAETGAREASPSADRPPAAPSENDPSPLGDTDRHSDADA